MKVLEDTKNKAKYEFIWRRKIINLLIASPFLIYLGYCTRVDFAFCIGAMIFLFAPCSFSSEKKDDDLSYKPTQLWMQGDKRVFDIIESKLDELAALKEQVSKLTLQINELQNQSSKMKNENIQE